MHSSEYFPPTMGAGEFHCPHCNVYAEQHYAHLYAIDRFEWASVVDQRSKFNGPIGKEWIATRCQRCGELALWMSGAMLYPKRATVPNPNQDLSDEIKADYREAASILSDSPRAAAAILRLALQKLCRQLGEKGENINEDIGSLVRKGLNPLVQRSLDALRITGNNAVHPGEIDLTEEPERVQRLFSLLNFIASKMITEPREIEAFYSELPEGARSAIARRDGSV